MESARWARWSSSAVLLLFWTLLLAQLSSSWYRSQSDLPPAWDHALYLRMSLRFHRSLEEGGSSALLRELSAPSPVAPLFPLSTLPLYRLFGESRETAQWTLAPFLFVLLLGTALLSLRAGASSAYAALAVFLASTFAGIVNFSREYMMDLPAAALATLALWALWSSAALTAGILAGLTLLTKVLAGVFFPGPLFYSISKKRSLSAAALFALGAVATSFFWYWAHHREIARYVLDYGFGEGSLPFRSGGSKLFAFENLTYYLGSIAREGVGVLPFAILILSIATALYFRWKPKPFLTAWLATGYIFLTLLPNKGGERYVLALLPPLAVFAAGAISAVPVSAVRRSLAALAVLAGTLNFCGLTWQCALSSWTHHHFGTFPHHMPFGEREMRGWPADAVLETLSRIRDEALAPPSDDESRRFVEETAALDDESFLRSSYRTLLKREPDREGHEAYGRDLAAGKIDREHVVESLMASGEFLSRPLKVLVVPDHRVFNASTLAYLAESSRRAIMFHHPSTKEELDDLLAESDVVLFKDGGPLGPPPFESTLSEMAERFRTAPNKWSFSCPDGSLVQLLKPRTSGS